MHILTPIHWVHGTIGPHLMSQLGRHLRRPPAPSITCLTLIPNSSRASGWQQVGHVLQVDTLRFRLRLFSMNRNPDESDARSASKNLLRAWEGGLGENEYMYMYG